MKVKNFKELIVWQKSIDLVLEIYKITKQFPSEEKFGLCAQMQRASVSIPSNIAEGSGRNHTNEFKQYLGVAYGSSSELETQIIIAKKLYSKFDYIKAESLNLEIQKMINGLINSLKVSSTH